jgi:hypothetical protein
MTVSKGLFTFYRRADDNKVLIEILPAQLDKTFLFSGTLDQAVGERGFYGAQQIGEFPLMFHQVGKSVQLVIRNTAFTAPDGSPAARGDRALVPELDPGRRQAPVEAPSRPQEPVDRRLRAADPRPAGLRPGLTQAYQPTNYSFRQGKERDPRREGLRRELPHRDRAPLPDRQRAHLLGDDAGCAQRPAGRPVRDLGA